MALQGEQGVIPAHAHAIIRHADQAAPARPDLHSNLLSAGIQRILNEFLHHTGGPLHHLAGGDLVGDLFGKKVDPIHRPETCWLRAWTSSISR